MRIIAVIFCIFALTSVGHGQINNSVEISASNNQPSDNLVLVGGMHTIRWNNSNYSRNATVQIGIRDIRFNPNGGVPSGEETIVGKMRNTGEIDWLTPSRLGYMQWSGGNVYKIVIYINESNGESHFLESHLFRITN